MQISITINVSDPDEEWRTIGIAPDYKVSNYGNVKRLLKTKGDKPVTKHLYGNSGYEIVVLSCNGIHKTRTVHRLVADAFIDPCDGKPLIDHINGIKTDNRLSNLRRASAKQNSYNARKTTNETSSRYKGVTFDKAKNKWRAQIMSHGKNNFLGHFKSEKAAARAYDEAAIAFFKEFANLNNASDDSDSDEEVTIYNS